MEMTSDNIVIDRTLAARVLEVVSLGLCQGVGMPVPGEMCVEAAVKYAMGLPNGDDPPCVATPVRAFNIGLNDDYGWRSDKYRAVGLRRVAIAQLGSTHIGSELFGTAAAAHQKLLAKIVLVALWRKSEVAYRQYRDYVGTQSGFIDALSAIYGFRVTSHPDRNQTRIYLGVLRNHVLCLEAEAMTQALIALGTEGGKYVEELATLEQWKEDTGLNVYDEMYDKICVRGEL